MRDLGPALVAKIVLSVVGLLVSLFIALYIWSYYTTVSLQKHGTAVVAQVGKIDIRFGGRHHTPAIYADVIVPLSSDKYFNHSLFIGYTGNKSDASEMTTIQQTRTIPVVFDRNNLHTVVDNFNNKFFAQNALTNAVINIAELVGIVLLTLLVIYAVKIFYERHGLPALERAGRNNP